MMWLFHTVSGTHYTQQLISNHSPCTGTHSLTDYTQC